MFKNKNLLSVIALVCAVIALILSVIAILPGQAGPDQSYENPALEQQVQALQTQIDALVAASQAGTSGSAYCHLLVGDWEGTPEELTLTSAIAQVTLPAVGTDGAVPTVQSAQLVLRLGIEEVGREPVVLTAGESEGTFEMTLTGISFALPKLAENDQVDLWLEVVLSDGQILLSPSSSWYCSGDKLHSLAG